ncbi:MAG: enoyl-CoA hydratase/isomerase family protein, partial [Parvularculaceae bacterium]|nr:enoyl-CoA hydratase/isomerase family protein [Parvularculaceae bacterium]
AKNAMNAAIIEGLLKICAHLKGRGDLRALVLRGEGQTFCAGGDLKEFASWAMTPEPDAGKPDPIAVSNRRLGDLLLALDALPQAVVSVVEGASFGGGMGFVAVSDVVIAAEDAKFSLSEATLGLTPAQIGPFVVRKLGLFEARRLAVTGARFSSAEALRVGFVSRVAADVDAALAECLTEIGRCEPSAIAATKRIFNASAGAVGPMLLDAASFEFAALLRGPGLKGAAAFAQKQPAPWVEVYDA